MMIKIRGMSCESCARTIEAAVKKVPGTSHVSVSFAMQKLALDDLPRAELVDNVLDAIRDAGYDAVDPRMTMAEKENPWSDLEARHDRTRALGALGFTAPVLLLAFLGRAPFVQATLASMVVLIAGWPIHKKAWAQLTLRQTSMDTLVSLGSLAALFQSFLLLARHHPHAHFDGAALIVAFILLGRWLEARARVQTSSSQAELWQLLQAPIDRREEDDSWKATVGTALVSGDTIRLAAGSVASVDAKLIEGRLFVDESQITGEPTLIEKQAGDQILSGTIIKDGAATLTVLRAGHDSFLGTLLSELEKAQTAKAPIQRWSDRITGIFVPAVMTLAMLAGFIHFAMTAQWSPSLNITLTVLLIACPCALGLAVPTALVAAMGAGAQRGVLFRTPEVLERLAQIKIIYFDKTGTLTLGQPHLSEIEVLDEKKLEWMRSFLAEASGAPSTREIAAPDLALALAFVVEEPAQGPTAEGFRRAWARRAQPTFAARLPKAFLFKSTPGYGVEALVEGHKIVCGKASAGATASDLTVDGHLTARFFFTDTVVPEAAETLRQLRDHGFQLHLLTGDRQAVAQALQQTSQLPLESVHGDLSPQDKKQIVAKAVRANPQQVTFVGDGINDVLALDEASVGISMASASPVAMASGQLVLTQGIKNLPFAFKAATLARRQIKINLFWAAIYNVAMIPLAASGRMEPVWASLSMALSSVTVVTASLWLKRRLMRGRSGHRVVF